MPPDAVALALIRHLCRDGTLDASDIDSISAELDAQGLPGEAHAVRCEMIEAMAPPQSEWDAERRRARFAVVRDGGNDPG